MKKKDKNGFTLVELLAVIGILSILIMITVPALTTIRNNTLKNSLKSKINLIESAAKEYGNDYLMSIPSEVIHTKEAINNYNINSCIDNYLDNEKTETCNNDCLIVVVRTLIEQGYLIGDDMGKNTIKNPLTDTSLNNELVCIRYDSNNAMERKMIAYVIGKNKWFSDEN